MAFLNSALPQTLSEGKTNNTKPGNTKTPVLAEHPVFKEVGNSTPCVNWESKAPAKCSNPAMSSAHQCLINCNGCSLIFGWNLSLCFWSKNPTCGLVSSTVIQLHSREPFNLEPSPFKWKIPAGWVFFMKTPWLWSSFTLSWPKIRKCVDFQAMLQNLLIFGQRKDASLFIWGKWSISDFKPYF